ncbi:MAG: ATP-binding protein [Caldilineaceae bacterium]|nr:ATP-binding protein [Caldilineaceae bacterium]
MNKSKQRNVTTIQQCFDRLITATPEHKPKAFHDFSNSILHHFNHINHDDASHELFSVELPFEIQSFAAVWLLRALVDSRTALGFGNTEPQATTLFDRVFAKRLYKQIGLEPKQQGFQKIQVLIEFAQGILQHANDLTGQLRDLRSVPELRDNCMRHFNRKNGTSQLSSLFPRSLTRANNTRLKELFEAVEEYTDVVEEDPLAARDKVNRLCERYESEAIEYGSHDAVHILGTIARNLKGVVNKHFERLEADTPGTIEIVAIDKKYPLEQPGAMFTFHIKLINKGSRPVRDITLDEIITDAQIQLDTRPTHWGTVYPRTSEIFGIDATVLTKCTTVNILFSLTWVNIRGPRISREMEFVLTAQRTDVNWDKEASVEPYSLEAVTDEQDLVGRKRELSTLRRLASQQTIGSAFIFGQKRVGKTSIANAVSKILSSDSNQHWFVIYKGAGDYVGTNAATTMKRLGYVLAEDLRKRVLGLSAFQMGDFEDGLAPLSSVVDEALEKTDAKLLFILDEFDEIPSDLLGRSNIATSFFLPIRQISIKPRCAFFLIGGENMREIMTNQGDRLNKFKPLRVDYFTRGDWGDFADLIRKPVQDWMTISDNALEVLFEWSAGNPYFAKFLAAEVSTAMIDKRQCDVSEVDMTNAIEIAAVSIGVNYFAHFWQDGIEVGAKDQWCEQFLR